MYLLTVIATATKHHPDHGAIGDEAHIACWIERDAEEQAISVAHEMIVANGWWDVVRTEAISIVTDTDYEDDDEFGPYYEQALIDKEVLVINTCPRYPVYYMKFKIASRSSENIADKARVWIVNECVFDGHDPMKPDFWSGDRVKHAIALSTDAIASNGYDVVNLIDQCPCSRDESSEDCQFFDDAEEDGLCLVFVHDQPA